MSKWEMETEPLIDKIFHHLIGYSEDETGVWKPDKMKSEIMNTKGASEFVQELRSVFTPNMQMSELNDEFIRVTAATIGSNFNNKLCEFYNEWSVFPSPSTFKSICDQLVHQAIIYLNIARNAGMRKHREKRGVKTYFNPMAGGGAL